ncbi:DUF4238 domain-containing protein [Bradyrhizobium guangzhouense]|uniref:DUF4238 domain-containing protein n=1 Tax=Bradyrhizobium guangzhouense TaxID=1325095 RepID=A0AAE5WWB4_9BRAD|nr:DUF4238 domain-containing protein [Bradyrhizobium guangzhouense]QAU44193.1 hypothetical protein XH91_01690 [Bradyrhizobium guangzhouense]
MSDGKPRDHHFVPVFYLRQWHNGNKKLFEHKRVYDGRIAQKEVSATATGFQRDLYAFPTLGSAGYDQYLENRFFKLVDDEGAIALHRLLERDPNPWTPEHRSGWSRFLLSVRLRHPDAMNELKAAIPTAWNRGSAASQAGYERLRKPDDPGTFEEFIARRDPHVMDKVSVNMIMRAIENVEIGTHINGMHWRVFEVKGSRHDLITSDRPVHYYCLREEHGFISLPIAPRKLFVAANSPRVLNDLLHVNPTRVVSEVNKRIAAQARRYVYTQSREANAKLIEKYFGIALEPSPLFPSL